MELAFGSSFFQAHLFCKEPVSYSRKDGKQYSYEGENRVFRAHSDKEQEKRDELHYDHLGGKNSARILFLHGASHSCVRKDGVELVIGQLFFMMIFLLV